MNEQDLLSKMGRNGKSTPDWKGSKYKAPPAKETKIFWRDERSLGAGEQKARGELYEKKPKMKQGQTMSDVTAIEFIFHI